MRKRIYAFLSAGLLSVTDVGLADGAVPDAPLLLTRRLPPPLKQEVLQSGTPVDLAIIDKSGYTLLNPTPRQYLRGMEALYRSPYTVDAGRAQIETYLVGYAYDHDTANGIDTRTQTWRIAPTTLKLGVLNDLELQLDLAPYTRVRAEDRIAGTTGTQNGFGDVTARAKLNLRGNDGGATALALAPFVKFPTSQDNLGNNAFEGGLTVPVAVELPWGWWLGLSPELSFLQDSDGRGYSPAIANIAYLWHEIIGKLSGYIQFSSWVSFESSSHWIGTVDFGLAYLLKKNLQLDAGVLVGVTRAAPDVNPFLGASIRF